MLNKFAETVSNLAVNEERMLENLERSKGVVFSGKLLLELIDKGLTREEAYDRVQAAAFAAKREAIEFKDALLKDEGIRSVLSHEEIDAIFDIRYYIRHVDRIFRRVGI
jgi:adenylosuccinate lyase